AAGRPRHRPARDLHAPRPSGCGRGPGADGAGREPGRRGGRRLYRPGDGREPRAAWRGGDPGPGDGRVLASFDEEMTTPIADEMRKHGVELLVNESVGSFAEGSQGLEVRLGSGRILDAQLVVVGVGVRPENSLAVAAGLAVGLRGGIRVND